MKKKIIIGTVVGAVLLIGGISAAAGGKGSTTTEAASTTSVSAPASSSAAPSITTPPAPPKTVTVTPTPPTSSKSTPAPAPVKAEPSAGCVAYLGAVDAMISQADYTFDKVSTAFAAAENFDSNGVTLLEQGTYEMKVLSAKTDAATELMDGCEDRALKLKGLPLAMAAGKVMSQGVLVTTVLKPGQESPSVDKFDDLVGEFETAVAEYRVAIA